MANDKQDRAKARELQIAAYTFLDNLTQTDASYREMFKAGIISPFEAERLANFAAHITSALTAENERMKAELAALRASFPEKAEQAADLLRPVIPEDSNSGFANRSTAAIILRVFGGGE